MIGRHRVRLSIRETTPPITAEDYEEMIAFKIVKRDMEEEAQAQTREDARHG